jgi:DNA ligase 1
MSKFSPMLGTHAPSNLSSLRYPLLLSEKLDGIRCLIAEIEWARANLNFQSKHQEYLDSARYAIALSRSGKPIPNRFVQEQLDSPDLIGLDGELLASDKFNETSSAIMSHAGEPAFHYRVFDLFDRPSDEFEHRNMALEQKAFPRIHSSCAILRVPHVAVHRPKEIIYNYESLLTQGAEGVILRDPKAPYKFGRSTIKQQGMLKIKPLIDFEATVIDVEQGSINTNRVERDELGYARRSTYVANLVPNEILGALTCEKDGVRFRVGIFKGFTKDELRLMWKQRQFLIGKIAKLQSMDHGVVDKPRHCRFLGFRDTTDL